MNNHGRVGFVDKRHGIGVFRTTHTASGIRAYTGKNQFIAHGFDFNTVGDAVHVTNGFLEITAGQIDYSGIFHIGENQLFGFRFNEPQFVVVTLFNVFVVELQTEFRNNAFMVIVFVDINSQNIFVGDGGNDFEKLLGVGANNDFLGMTYILFEIFGMEDDVDEDGVGFAVEINDFQAFLGESDGDIG